MIRHLSFLPSLKSILTACCCLLLYVVQAQPGGEVIVFKNATIIDGVSETPLQQTTLVISGGKIQAIMEGDADVAPDAQIIDLKGTDAEFVQFSVRCIFRLKDAQNSTLVVIAVEQRMIAFNLGHPGFNSRA